MLEIDFSSISSLLKILFLAISSIKFYGFLSTNGLMCMFTFHKVSAFPFDSVIWLCSFHNAWPESSRLELKPCLFFGYQRPKLTLIIHDNLCVCKQNNVSIRHCRMSEVNSHWMFFFYLKIPIECAAPKFSLVHSKIERRNKFFFFFREMCLSCLLMVHEISHICWVKQSGDIWYNNEGYSPLFVQIC